MNRCVKIRAKVDESDVKKQPIYWFVILETAIERGDFATAVEAQHQLSRLGVTVRYGRPRNPKGGL